MNIELVQSRYPLSAESYKPYLNRSSSPMLDLTMIDALCLVASDNSSIRTPMAGDMAIVLRYKMTPGAISSFKTDTEDFTLLQLQGARSKVAYRLAQGLYWTDFMADEAVTIASHPSSGIRRLVMPGMAGIDGIELATSEHAAGRYREFAMRAALVWSQEDRAFVRDIK